MAKRSWVTGENAFWESGAMNNRTYKQYFDRLVDIAISSFKWINLPDSIDPRFLEITLFYNGQIAFFKDSELGAIEEGSMLALPFSNNGLLDVYNNPVSFRAYANNGYQKELTNKDAVICWNNMMRTNSVFDAEQYAYRLYQLERTLDVNINAQKTPVLVRCSENQRLVLKNLYMKYDGNQPFIFGDKDLDMKSLQVLKTDAPYLVDRLQQAKAVLWNEALTYFGIANVSSEKKERMITDEVARGMGGVFAARHSRLKSRQNAAEAINRMFGTNIQVEFNDVILDASEALEDESESEVSDNG